MDNGLLGGCGLIVDREVGAPVMNPCLVESDESEFKPGWC